MMAGEQFIILGAIPALKTGIGGVLRDRADPTGGGSYFPTSKPTSAIYSSDFQVPNSSSQSN